MPAEGLPRARRDLEPLQDQHHEEQHDRGRAHEPQLLTHQCQDKIRMRLGQKEQLLLPFAQSHAEETATAERQKRLRHLEARIAGILPRLQKGHDALPPIARPHDE